MNRAHPDVSVVICTRNRASELELALAGLTRQAPGGPAFEVLVVDNGSSDRTREVAEGFAGSLSLTYLFESRLGLCHARNAGWRQARAAVVGFLDDDAVAEAGWVQSVVAAFRDGGPGVGCVGGRIVPVWDAPRPRWLADRAALGLTMIDWSEAPKAIDDLRYEWLAGANIAFRRDVLIETGGFHPALDRAGNRLLSSGDVYLEKQVQQLGYALWYHPAMAVRHRVRRDRLTKRWFRRRYFWQGVSDAVMELLDTSPSVRQRLHRAAGRLGKILLQPRRVVDLMLPVDDPHRFEQKCWTWIACGHVAGLLGIARR
jgi:glycosyltransferase involved in cell wall biosynthesis